MRVRTTRGRSCAPSLIESTASKPSASGWLGEKKGYIDTDVWSRSLPTCLMCGTIPRVRSPSHRQASRLTSSASRSRSKKKTEKEKEEKRKTRSGGRVSYARRTHHRLPDPTRPSLTGPNLAYLAYAGPHHLPYLSYSPHAFLPRPAQSKAAFGGRVPYTKTNGWTTGTDRGYYI